MAKPKVHPMANIFPMLGDEEFKQLKADIEANGLRQEIVYWKNQLIDGRNRLKACTELKIEPMECEIDEDADPVAYIISANIHRRQLTPMQRAMVGDELRDYYDKEAAKRKQANGGSKEPEVKSVSPPPKKARAREEAGKAVGVSGPLMDHARKVNRKGTDELKAAVKAGELSGVKAAKIADLPPEEQNKIVSGDMKLPSKPKQSAPKPTEPAQDKPSKKQASGFGSLLQDAIDDGRLLVFSHEVISELTKAVIAMDNPGHRQALLDHLGNAADEIEGLKEST